MSIVLQSSKQFKYTENSFLVFRIRLLLFSSLTRRNNRKRKDVKHIDNHLSFLSYFNVNNLLETKFLSKKKRKNTFTLEINVRFFFLLAMFVGFSLSLSTHIEIFIVCMKDITKREIQNTNNTHTYMYAYIRSSIITRKKEEEKRTETKSNKQQRRR